MTVTEDVLRHQLAHTLEEDLTAAIVRAAVEKNQGWLGAAAEETLWRFPLPEAHREVTALLARRDFVLKQPQLAGRLLDRAAQAGAAGLAPMCFPLAADPAGFPGNFGDEQFWAVADANLTGLFGSARLVTASSGSQAQPPPLGRLPGRRGRDGGGHEHRHRALDAGRGRGQALRADQGPEDHLPDPGGGAVDAGLRHAVTAHAWCDSRLSDEF